MNKFIDSIKRRFMKKNTKREDGALYAFSTEELRCLTRDNQQKISELKRDVLDDKKKEEPNVLTTLKKIHESTDISKETIVEDGKLNNQNTNQNAMDETVHESQDNVHETQEKNEKKVDKTFEKETSFSFVHLSDTHQKLVMNSWAELDMVLLNEDIEKGKELYLHKNENGYSEEASRYIHSIRKKYEIVICYLIGFNNESKGMGVRTSFATQSDEEWKYLNQYIKILEKIRNQKK